MLAQLLAKLADLIQRYGQRVVAQNAPTAAGQKIYQTAKGCVGQTLAPLDPELGCAESVIEIIHRATNDQISNTLSTTTLYGVLLHHAKFVRVTSPLAGDIIISPTAFGDGRLDHGHTGIIIENNNIMSNNSATGCWSQNYNLFTWIQRYKVGGAFPVVFFRRII